MLRTEFRFALDHWPQRLLAVLLGESFLGFLAIVAVALTLFPMLFAVSPLVHAAIETAQWLIIAWFGFEYVFAFASTPAKGAFLRNPWRLLDLATILIPLATLLPTVSQSLRSSPVLRLVRLTRLIVLGVRVSGVTTRHRRGTPVDATTSAPAKVLLLADAPQLTPSPATWADLQTWLRAPGEEWFHVSDPGREQLAEIAAAANLPTGFLEAHLLGTSYPHVAAAGGWTGVFVWLPEKNAAGQIERHGVLFLFSARSVLSFSRRSTTAVERITARTTMSEGLPDETPFATRMLALLLRQVVQQNERIVGGFEQDLRGLEDVPLRESSPAFFERTFHLKKELSATQADLWRLKGVAADLAGGRSGRISGEAVVEVFRRLSTDLEYLYDTVVNVRDETLSVIELHLNIVSFDMNRVMRVLAVVSVLGLIPAVIGGLFGMNLIDNPWPFTLPQVAFTISFGMVLCLYFFFVKGWLR